MKSHRWKTFAGLGVLILLVGMACNLATQTAATEPPPSVPPPAPTETSEPPEPTPTLRPPKPTPTPRALEAEPTPASGVLFELSQEPYVHPQGIFELYPPVGWDVTAEDDGSALFEAPDFTGAILVQVTNTGYALDPVAFENFVDARDVNFFSVYDGYEEVDRQIDADNGTATVVKRLLFDDVPQTVVTYYDQHDQVIYVLDFWADEDLFDAYADGYDAFFDEVTIDTQAAADQDLYLWIMTFTGPADLFTIEVPTSWRYEMAEGDFAIVDTFYSPDEHAVIQNIAYDDGEPISKSEAGAFALELLKTYYADDIKITDDQVQPDGSERLTWNSPSGDFSGISFFESRGTTFLLFTVMYDNPFEDIYLDVLDYTISTYQVP